MEKVDNVIRAMEQHEGAEGREVSCVGCPYEEYAEYCLTVLHKDVLAVIGDLQEKLKMAKDSRLELARKLRVVTVERDAERAKIARLTGMVHKEWLEKVRPDWYECLSNLDYEYSPVKDGEPWYHVKDVWDCIEEVAE